MEAHVKCVLLGLAIRLVFIVYGEWHDKNFSVPFTDVDYKVFSDAARHVTAGESPYKRHTYRYPPILAWLLLPNIFIQCWGKILFSLIDVFLSVLYLKLAKVQEFSDFVSLSCAQVWMFNPLTIIISTRGNSDSLISLTVLASAYFLLKNQAFLAGLLSALSIHIRLYPVIFLLPMYLALQPETCSKLFEQRVRDCLKKLIPNRSQIIFVFSCLFFLTFFTVLSYWLYGDEFLRESIFYHLTRKDTRHNFSIYFYLLYLEPEQPGILMFFPQAVLLLLLSLIAGQKSSLLFCLFAQAFVVVSYNPVLTSQYFIWHLSLLVPNLPRFDLNSSEAAKLGGIWLFSQLAWLVPAYLLEFRGRNTFLFIWFQGVGFFCANLAVLVKLIKKYRWKEKKIAVKMN